MIKCLDKSSNATETAMSTATSSDRSSQLEDLVAQATHKYSVKDYDAAAEIYAYATELQADLNGEMSPKNANLLYAYGRCLYHVAVKKSDVLGSVVVGEKETNESRPARSMRQVQSSNPETEASCNVKDGDASQDAAPECVGEAQTMQAERRSLQTKEASNDKPYFHFKGDEDWDASSGDMEDDDINEEPDDQQDDFLDAYEVLDMARLLLQGKIVELEQDTGHGIDQEDMRQIRQLKERLADIHDLQAEICLEGERFSSAVEDLRTSLHIKEAILPQESSLIAEGHYKLSLALEFLSATMQKNSNGGAIPGSDAREYAAVREEAADELKAAIRSCNIRLKREEKGLHEAELNVYDMRAAETAIDDVKGMVKDLEQRLLDIRQPIDSSGRAENGGSLSDTNSLDGILGVLLEKPAAARLAKLEAMSRDAKDVTGLIKKRSAAESAPQNGPLHDAHTLGKRKAHELEEVECGKSSKMADVRK